MKQRKALQRHKNGQNATTIAQNVSSSAYSIQTINQNQASYGKQQRLSGL